MTPFEMVATVTAFICFLVAGHALFYRWLDGGDTDPTITEDLDAEEYARDDAYTMEDYRD